jgi:hypothetical protein
MIRSFSLRFKPLLAFAVGVAAISLASCSENIEGGASCPLLCPQTSAPLKDTIIDAIVLDTSATGFPDIGFESNLIIAMRQDSSDVRAISRFDSLSRIVQDSNTETTITEVDSAFARLVVPTSDTALKFGYDGVIEAYDVAGAANDTSVADLAAQFTASNLLGSYSYKKGDSPDTLDILLDTARVRAHLLNDSSVRLGFRMVSSGSDQIRFMSIGGGLGAQLVVYPSRDSSAAPVMYSPHSLTPSAPALQRAAFADFQITVKGGKPTVPNVLRVGGAPAHRVLFRLSLPNGIVDSAVVVRATLLLTKKPSETGPSGDSVTIHIAPVVASSAVTGTHELLEFAGAETLFPVDSLKLAASDSGQVGIQMVTLLRAWRQQDTLQTPRRAALFLSNESAGTSSFDFFSHEAADPALRPKLRITYVTSVSSGRP